MAGRLRSTLAGLALTASATTPLAAEEVRLAPIAGRHWVADFQDAKCRLSRLFGEEGDQTLLIFDQFQPSSAVNLTVAGESVSRIRRGEEVNARFGPEWPQPVELGFRRVEFEGFGPALFLSIPTSFPSVLAAREGQPAAGSLYDVAGLAMIDSEMARGIEWLELSYRGNSLILELPGLSAAFEVLNQCTADLVSHWGLDVEAHRTMIRQPEPINLDEIADVIISSYPRAALIRGEQATIHLRIMVDADGSIEECVLTDITATERLDSPACEVFGERAMFVPGEDAAGEPMRSFYSTNIVYIIGRSLPGR